MKIREALLTMAPSLALQRAAADEIARLDAQVAHLLKAIRAQNPDLVQETDDHRSSTPPRPES